MMGKNDSAGISRVDTLDQGIADTIVGQAEMRKAIREALRREIRFHGLKLAWLATQIMPNDPAKRDKVYRALQSFVENDDFELRSCPLHYFASMSAILGRDFTLAALAPSTLRWGEARRVA